MKKMTMILAMMMTIAISANAMTYREARRAAQVMTDKMASELRLTDRQYDKVYDINLRYIENPVAKDRALSRVLTARQYDLYMRHRPAPMAAAPRHPAPVVAKKPAPRPATPKAPAPAARPGNGRK